jgi:hypothetical protein
VASLIACEVDLHGKAFYGDGDRLSDRQRAPSLAEAVERVAERARTKGWTREEVSPPADSEAQQLRQGFGAAGCGRWAPRRVRTGCARRSVLEEKERCSSSPV